MTRARMLACLILASSSLVPISIAQETPTKEQTDIPEWPKRVIEYEVLDEPVKTVEFEALPGQTWPSYAATFTVGTTRTNRAMSEFHDRRLSIQENRDALTARLLEQDASRHFSDSQREYVRSSTWVHSELAHAKDPEGGRYPTRYTLYAVSEQDARWMTRAVLEYIDSDSRKTFEDYRSKLPSRRASVETLQAELATAEATRDELKVRFGKKTDGTPYRSKEDAIKDIDRLLCSLRSVEIDVAGIEAKIAAIRTLRAKKSDNAYGDTIKWLEGALVEQDIELAGALARKNVVERYLARAKEVRDLGRAVDDAVQAVSALSQKRDIASRNMKFVEGQLKLDMHQPPMFRPRGPVRLLGNVLIQQVDYREEGGEHDLNTPSP